MVWVFECDDDDIGMHTKEENIYLKVQTVYR